MSELGYLPWEVRDPWSRVPSLSEWTPVLGVRNPRAAVADFLKMRVYDARNYPDGLTLEVRHPTSAPDVYLVRVTVPRPRFKVHMHTKKPMVTES